MSEPPELTALAQAVRGAGALVRDMAAAGFAARRKADRSLVTEADLAADRLLKERLLAAMPASGYLSEETADDPSRLTRAHVWIVDPIDGTREFVEGVPHYSVSAALAEDGQVILAAVYNPARDELFCARAGGGATLNGQPISASRRLGPRLTVLASRSEIQRGEFDPFRPHADIEPVGSIAYKLALVAAGRADATFSLGPKNEWDIAAGVLLVTAAGGHVADRWGQPLRFNQPRTLLPGIVASTAQARQGVWDMIRAVAGDGGDGPR